jgi:pseudouridine-5'-phosphate glycosidase
LPERRQFPRLRGRGETFRYVGKVGSYFGCGCFRKPNTRDVLGRILEITEGRSLRTNIALVKNNARLAARIAIALTA